MPETDLLTTNNETTIMGPHGINRAVHRISFSDCQNGLGVKIIGGYRAQTAEDYGIFIKRILPGGVAAVDSRLLAGDLILDVNGENLTGVTNERAVDILRTASASNHMSLLVARDEEAKKEFLDLMDKYGSHSDAHSARSSPTQLLAGKPVDSLSSGSSSRSQSPQLPPEDIITTVSRKNSVPAAPPKIAKDSAFQIISVCKGASLGLDIVGGIDRNEGPLVYIQEIIPGGDCHKIEVNPKRQGLTGKKRPYLSKTSFNRQMDGRLQPGDQLVSINKESMIGVSHEEAKSIIDRARMRFESFCEIAFIRQKSAPSSSENLQRPSSLVPPSAVFVGQQAAGPRSVASPNTKLVSALLPNAVETRVKMEEQSPITSAESGPADVSVHVIAPSHSNGYKLPGRKAFLNSTIRLKAEKLERALNYLGIQPSAEQQQALRQRLQKDSKGTVSFGDFIEVSRNLFSVQLDAMDGGQKPVTFGIDDIVSLLDSQLVTWDPLEDDVEKLKKERNEALKEMSKLKEELSESVNLQKQLTEELQVVKQEAKAAVEETRALRSRIHLAEAAQRQARGMEMDYEEVIRLLEAEIVELKAQLSDHCGQNKDNIQDLRKRVTVLDCQLRKSESARKSFEVATEKLLQFVEVVHEMLSENSPSSAVLSDRRTPLSSKALLARLGRIGPTVTTALAAEARDLAKSVRAILEVNSWDLAVNVKLTTSISKNVSSKNPAALIDLPRHHNMAVLHGFLAVAHWESSGEANSSYCDPAMEKLNDFVPLPILALSNYGNYSQNSVESTTVLDGLPYGWEEAYTADGIKYFINHVTQTTSWIHPVTSALSLLCSEDDDDGIRDPPGSKSH